MDHEEERAIQVRGLNEFVYCPRLYYFMYIENLFVESAVTLSGKNQHDAQEKRLIRKKEKPPRIQQSSNKRKQADTTTEEVDQDNPFGEIPRNFKFGENRSGLIGVLDAIEEKSGSYSPVESKHGPAPDGKTPFHYEALDLPSTVWPNDLAQLAGQIHLLRENNFSCEGGYLYYRGSRKRVHVPWTQEIDSYLKLLLNQIRELPPERPLPLKNSRKCLLCSLQEICLPDETWASLPSDTEKANVRTITAPRYDKSILHIIDSRAKVGVSGDNLRVTDGEGNRNEFHLKDIFSLSIYGNAQVTTQAIGACVESGISVAYFRAGGRLKGVLQPFSGKNLDYRQSQYDRFKKKDPQLSSGTIAAKISNQRTFLRRNSELDDFTFQSLKELMEKADECHDPKSLLGYEGSAARLYYKNFNGMIQPPFRNFFRMEERNRRPPRDPVNALLSFAYTLLARDATNACISVGLDPGFGFFHSREKGRPSLALDIMEPYRPIIADSAVVRAINTGMVQEKDFQITPAGTVMKEGAKKGLLRAYQARADSEITHPMFQYSMSYRRILEVEVRLLARHLEGELPEWKPLRVR